MDSTHVGAYCRIVHITNPDQPVTFRHLAAMEQMQEQLVDEKQKHDAEPAKTPEQRRVEDLERQLAEARAAAQGAK